MLLKHIRRRLLSKNKLTTYLFYAIGEIFLVVVGILIAVQIDDWQQQKNDRQKEITILQNLQEDILLDTFDINFNLHYHYLIKSAEQELLSILENRYAKSELDFNYENVLATPLFTMLHQAAFINLQNNDFSIISNNELKKKISQHFDYYVRAIMLLENDWKSYDNLYVEKRKYFLKHFSLDADSSFFSNENKNTSEYFNPNFIKRGLSVKNMAALKNDEAFKIILTESLFLREVKIQFYEDLLKRIFELNQAIEIELNRN